MRRYWITACLGVLLAGVVALASPQQTATLTLRSGAQLSGELVDLGGAGFTFRVNGQDRDIPKGDVQSIDFGGNGIDVPEAARTLAGGTHLLVLRNGDVVAGEFYDVGGANPIRLTFRTSTGEREYSGADVRRIYMARVDGSATAGGGGAVTPAPTTPSGTGRTVRVLARNTWTPTGIMVKQGQVLRFDSSGEVRITSNDVAAPAGNNRNLYDNQAPIPSVLQGALIARVLAGRGAGTPFAIGNQTSVPMPAGGQLYLGVNDGQRNDNSGEFTVVIYTP